MKRAESYFSQFKMTTDVKLLQINSMLKRAIIQKKLSSYSQSSALLDHILYLCKNVADQESLTPKQDVTVKKTIYKVWRELAKLEHLRKNKEAEESNWAKAKEMFGYGTGWKNNNQKNK